MESNKKDKLIVCKGFGIEPAQVAQHIFEIEIPHSGSLRIFERLVYAPEGYVPLSKNGCILFSEDLEVKINQLVISLPVEKFELVKNRVEMELNRVLEHEKKSSGIFSDSNVGIDISLGKELLVLLWAIEDISDADLIHTCLVNWLGLSSPERWFLYNMAHSSKGKRGWRRALSVALAELSD